MFSLRKMSTQRLYLEIALQVLLPIALLMVNAVDFAIQAKTRRGQFWYFQLKGRQKYVLHVFLLLMAVFWTLSYLISWSDDIFQALCAAYLIYLSIHAIVWRRMERKVEVLPDPL